MSVQKTLDDWHHGLRIFHRAHSRAASLFNGRNVALGIPTVILTAITGTSIFATTAATPEWVSIATGIMSLTAAVLAALQTFLRYSELAEKHRAAAQSYGNLRRETEEVLAGLTSDPPVPLPPDYLKSLRERWTAVDNAAPDLPQNVYDSVEKQLRRGQPSP
jgi:Petal formation-expressed